MKRIVQGATLMSKPIIAVQLYTVRDFLATPADVAKTLARIKKIGYDAVEGAAGCMAPEEFRKLALSNGITPIGAGAGLNELRDEFAKLVARCHGLGVKHVMIGSVPREKFPTLADWKKLFKELDAYAARLAKEGIALQYHNHMFEFEKLGVKKGSGGKTILELLYAHTKRIQAELDFGWIVRGGHNPVTWAKKLKDRLDHAHIKDWGVINDQPAWRAIGEGGIEWPDIFKACKASGTKCYIVEQDACPVTNDPFLSLAISRKNIKAFGLA